LSSSYPPFPFKGLTDGLFLYVIFDMGDPMPSLSESSDRIFILVETSPLSAPTQALPSFKILVYFYPEQVHLENLRAESLALSSDLLFGPGIDDCGEARISGGI
jgi:hypothetical protein